MKRLILLSTALVAFAYSAHAQSTNIDAPSKFYLKVGGGYFFSVSQGQFPDVGQFPPQDIIQVVDPVTGVTTITSQKVLTGSYGAGGRGGLTFGWNINRYIALEGTFNYFHSQKNLMTKNLTTIKGTSQVAAMVESHGYVNDIDFAPSVVINPGFEKVNPYVRFGVVVPLWGNLNIETDANTNTPVAGGNVAQTTIHRKEKINPNVTIGFQGALGVIFPVAHKLDIFVEAEYRNVPVKGKNKEVKEYSAQTNVVNPANGEVVATSSRGLNDLSEAERKTVYETTLNQSSNTAIGTQGLQTLYKDNNAPSNDLKSYINIGGLGANAGIRFRF
jgi:hypothetical protein